MRHCRQDDQVGGRKVIVSHSGAVYQKISDLHKADQKRSEHIRRPEALWPSRSVQHVAT